MSDRYLQVVEDIPFGDRGIYAYRKGDKILESAVEANGWQDYVASPSTKAAKKAVADASGEES